MIIRKPDPKRITIVNSLSDLKAERGNFCDGYIGFNKTGKSSVMRQKAEGWASTRIPNLLSNVKYQIVGYDPQNVFGEKRDDKGNIIQKNLIDLHIELDDPDWALRLCECKNTLVIIDEINDLLEQTHYRQPRGLGRFFTQYWYNNNDVMWSIHNPIKAPNSATGHTTHYYIFMTFSKDGSFKKGIPSYTIAKTSSDEVNNYVRKYGKGKHRLDPEYAGQGFPHIIVDVQNGTAKAINMEKEVSNYIKEAIPLKK